MMIGVQVLLRWWWLLVICLLIGSGCGLAVMQRLPPLYSATASVQIDVPSTRTSAIIQPLAAYAALVSSDVVLQPVLHHFSVEDQQILVSRQLLVSSDAPSQTISIRVVLKRASLASLFANLLAQTLVMQQNKLIAQEYDRELQTLKGRLDADQHIIEVLSQRYERADPTHTTLRQQLGDEIIQQQNLENQDYQLQQNLQSEQALVGAPFAIVQQAEIPAQPLSPLGSLPLLLLSIGLSAAGGCALIWLIERRLGRIYDPSTLQVRTGLMVLGSLRFQQKKLAISPMQAYLKNPLLEDSRMLLANTLLLSEETHARLLTITGLQDGPDSSMIALHLAGLLAQCQRNVLLIDAKLEHPTQHIWNEKPLERGLVELLELAYDTNRQPTGGKSQFRPKIREPGGPPIEYYLQRTALPSLQLLPAGLAQRDPTTILGMPALPRLLQQALNFVDFVIIDCPSFSRAEVHLLGASSDQILLVINSVHDRLPQVEQAIETLSRAGIKPGGLIVTQLKR